MKKALLLLIAIAIVGIATADAKTKTKAQKPTGDTQTQAAAAAKTKVAKTKVKKEKINKKDVFTDAEYKEIKTRFFQAEGYGDTYNCKVEKQRFCKVKDLDTGIFVLCDREVSKTQMQSAQVFYKYGRCVKMN